MYGRKVKLRFLFVSTILLILILTVFLVLKSLEENVVYFQSPSEIKSLTELTNNKIRVGGMVKKNSISMNSNEVNFIITDFKNEINVTYLGERRWLWMFLLSFPFVAIFMFLLHGLLNIYLRDPLLQWIGIIG